MQSGFVTATQVPSKVDEVDLEATRKDRAIVHERERVLAHIEASAGRRDSVEVLRWTAELAQLEQELLVVQ